MGPTGGAPPVLDQHCCGAGDFAACAEEANWVPFVPGSFEQAPFTFTPDLCTTWYLPFNGNGLPPRVAIPNLEQDFVAITKMTVTVNEDTPEGGLYRVGGLLVAPTNAYEPHVSSPWAKWELGFTNPGEDLLLAYRPFEGAGVHLHRTCAGQAPCDEPTGSREGVLGVCWKDGIVHAFFAPNGKEAILEYVPEDTVETDLDTPRVTGAVAVSILAASDYLGQAAGGGGSCGANSPTRVEVQYFGINPLGENSCMQALENLRSELEAVCPE